MTFVREGQTKVWWDSQGSGTPILLINGLSSPSIVWFRLVPLLATHHRVLTFDNLGTGQSDTPTTPWTMAAMADAAAAVIEASGESTVTVLGISMGGMIAQQLTLEYPELVSGLVLVATHAGMAHATGDPEAAAAIMSAGSLSGEERYEFIAPFAHARSTPPGRIAEDSAVRARQPTSEAGYQGQLIAAAGWERLADLKAIGCPTLVLHGDEDRLISVSSAETLTNAIPGARLTILPECGHQLFTDQTELGAQVVLDFLDNPTG